MTSGIYVIRCVSDGKVYVGSSIRCGARIRQHSRSLARGVHHSYHLQRAYELYGSDAFEMAVIEECYPCDLVRREQWWIDHFKAHQREHGFNIAPRADKSRLARESIDKAISTKLAKKRKATQEQRKALSIAHMGQTPWNKGRKMSPESVAKMSVAHKRFFASGGVPWSKGQTMPEATRHKISESRKGKCLGNTNGFQKGHGFWLGKKRPNVSGEFHWRNRRPAESSIPPLTINLTP